MTRATNSRAAALPCTCSPRGRSARTTSSLMNPTTPSTSRAFHASRYCCIQPAGVPAPPRVVSCGLTAPPMTACRSAPARASGPARSYRCAPSSGRPAAAVAPRTARKCPPASRRGAGDLVEGVSLDACRWCWPLPRGSLGADGAGRVGLVVGGSSGRALVLVRGEVGGVLVEVSQRVVGRQEGVIRTGHADILVPGSRIGKFLRGTVPGRWEDALGERLAERTADGPPPTGSG